MDDHSGNTVVGSSGSRRYQDRDHHDSHSWLSHSCETCCELETSVNSSSIVSSITLEDKDIVAEPTVRALSSEGLVERTWLELAKALCQVCYSMVRKYNEAMFYLQKLLSTGYKEVEVVTSLTILAKYKSQRLATQLVPGLILYYVDPVSANSSDSEDIVEVVEECEDGAVTRRVVTQKQAQAGLTGNDTVCMFAVSAHRT